MFLNPRLRVRQDIFTEEQAVLHQVMLSQFVMSCIRPINVIDLLNM